MTEAGRALRYLGGPPLAVRFGSLLLTAFGASPFVAGARLPLVIDAVFGLLLAMGIGGVGAWTLTIIDPATQRVRIWWGLFVPLRRWTYPFSAVDAVRVRPVRHSSRDKHGRSTTWTTYAVDLVGPEAEIVERDDRPDARFAAEEIAMAVGVKLDLAQGEPAIPPDRIREPWQERVRREGRQPAPPGAPPDGRIEATPSENGLTIDVPPVGFGVLTLLIPTLIAALPPVPVWWIASAILHDHYEDAPWRIAAGTAAIVWAVAARFTLHDATRADRVEVSPELVRIRWRSWVGASAHRIDASVIEGIELSGRNVLVRRDGRTVVAAVLPSRGHAEWLKSALEHHLIPPAS